MLVRVESKTKTLDQLVVIFVAADPHPFNRVGERLANGAMMIPDADGEPITVAALQFLEIE